ncbi:hypothetical protein HanIR_Chr14g0713961 [Helianthus annuus]|nr:hypothetical protein HanIR_Chr14g0713961 [Helianthus annuus]
MDKQDGYFGENAGQSQRLIFRQWNWTGPVDESMGSASSCGVMEFKELFGSFTGHRVGNRSTGMRYGSTGSAKSENQKVGF